LQFQAALLQRWSLPDFMCPFCPFVQVVSVNVSVFTLTAIAVDRHRAVLSPLSAPPTKLRAKVVIACIWFLSLAMATPMAVGLRVVQIPDDTVVTVVTDIGVSALAQATVPTWNYADADTPFTKPFCDLEGMSANTMLVYRMVLVVVQYLTPLVIISLVYTRMAHRLWGSRAPGNAEDSRDANLLRNKKKVIKMLVIVVALFAVCWMPLQTYNFLHMVYPDINRYRYINIIFFCCDWLAMSNSCYNPFIYGIYNEKFQREFRLRLAVCLRRSPAGRGQIPRELSNLDSGRWDWPQNARHATLALHREPAMEKQGDRVMTGSASGLSVITGTTALSP
ncbi:tachykinin-like peptides receptor 99D, partial [Thrips palmi]|uniref:Tachykinin-like peptides receptor 99D n=1 Tax=Thrips palmi TaxID=161013 RepID=A0A6P8ZLK3_THRPL